MPTALQGPPVASPRPELWRITDRRTFQALRRARPPRPPWPAHGHLAARARGDDHAPRGPASRSAARSAARSCATGSAAACGRRSASSRRPAGCPAGTYLLGGTAELAELPWPALVELRRRHHRRGPLVSPATRALHAGVRGYRRLTAGRPSPCRFDPSCSTYALEALERHGAARGTLAHRPAHRRCHPWGGHGWDPVPERKAN